MFFIFLNKLFCVVFFGLNARRMLKSLQNKHNYRCIMSNNIVCGAFSGERPLPPEFYGRLDWDENMKANSTGPKFEYEGFKFTPETHVARFEVVIDGSSARSTFKLPINLLHRIFMIEGKSAIC